MTNEDIPAALAIWQGLPGIGLRAADSPPALVRYLARNPDTSFVAFADGELVGVALAGHDGRRGLLHHVAVASRYQKNGIGRRLVEACLTALQAQGIEKVILFVKADNAEGKAFWKKCGWDERPDVESMSIVTGDDPNA